ncbi:MFS transporter [Streptosporangium pseudovulgare]|uniref:Major facilitator superfamily (MFS) profile domain-containing protein n=1 Tax=Streptosporangium pseudovulgare TaxID=35765 RepID=A0ABQ2RKL1_9ACTN|nr:MFS transporter [Streptosporangium pseudovulgare]GGQ31299.1 hypothetical protein GCM10010140_71720 [Streptosporangium pseudovulgare]
MIIGAPLMAMLTLRLPRRLTLMLALGVFAVGHLVVAVGSGFAVLLGARFVTALAAGAFWAVANVAAGRAAGPAAGSRALGLVGAGGMLANVVGVPLGAFAGQLVGWRGPFWVLAVLAVAAAGLIARTVPHGGGDRQVVSVRAEAAALRSGRLWLVLAACATTTGGVLAAYSYIAPLLTGRAGVAAGFVPLVLVGFGAGAVRVLREGLHTSCIHPEAGFWDGEPGEGGRAEAVRVPLADGTLVKLPVAPAVRGRADRYGRSVPSRSAFGRRACAGSRLHRGVDARHSERRHRVGEGLRCRHLPRWCPGRLSGHGRPQEPQGSRQALVCGAWSGLPGGLSAFLRGGCGRAVRG